MQQDSEEHDGVSEHRSAEHMQLSLWRRLYGYTRAYPRDLLLLGAFGLSSAVADVAFPLITKQVIDKVSAADTEASFAPELVAYTAYSIVLALSIGGLIRFAAKLRTQVSHDIRRDAFGNVQRLSVSYFDHRPVGWLMARMTSDCERLSTIMTWAFFDSVWGIAMMLGTAVTLLLMNVKLALCVLSVVPVLAWASSRFRKRMLQSARDVRHMNAQLTAAYNEGILGVLTSKAFGREQHNTSEFREQSRRMSEASVRSATLSALYVPVVSTLASLAVGLTLVVGGFDLFDGVIGTGTLIAALAYARSFFEPVEQLSRWFAHMQMAQASAERVLSLIDAVPTVRDSERVTRAIERQRSLPQRADIAPDGGPARIERIVLEQVGFAYDNGHEVLRDVSLEVRSGEMLAIVGPTGGGKSTLVNLICRFHEPTRGRVLIDGCDYRERSLTWLHQNLGMVLQTAHVFSGTIMDNIRYGKLTASDSEVIDAAQLAGAHAFVMSLENTYQTQVGEGGGRLSAGQKQLISVARAILADPRILVMDEATASVDTESERSIQRGLSHVLAGRIAFVIAHRLTTIRNATRIVVVDNGRIAEHGTHAELMQLRGHYYDLYRQQSLDQAAGTTAGAALPALA